MEKYICEQCGGSINPVTMKCEYCGTQYKSHNNQIIRVETFYNPVKTLNAGCRISKFDVECIGADNAAKHITNRLSAMFAQEIQDIIQLDALYDPERMEYNIHGMLKVVIPEQKSTYPFDRY